MPSSFKLLAAVLHFGLASLIISQLSAQTQQAPAPTPPAAIKSYVNEVLVPVVVHDGEGRIVGTLKKDDFQIFDDGKPQALTGFTLLTRSSAATTGTGAKPASVPNSLPAGPQPSTPGQRFVVLLFDDLNLSSSDLTQAQDAATKLIENSLTSDTVAVLATSGSNSGLTRDHVKLKAAVQNLKVSNLYRHNPHDCPNVDYYQGDLIVNKNDSGALQAAAEDALTCGNLDPSQASVAASMAQQAARRAVALGEQDARSTLGFMRLIASKLGALPGQRVLILISSGFLTPGSEAMSLKSQILDLAAQSSVVISAIDARGLYTTGVDASNQGGGSPIDARAQSKYLQASMTGNESVMAELADGTGGTFFRNSNNLDAGLGSLFTGPQYLYLLAFSTANTKTNGAYHTLKIKVNQSGLSIQARRGYFAPEVEKSKK